MASTKFTSAKENIVRVFHPVLQQELYDIAVDCDMPLQHVFNKFCDAIFELNNVDAILLKVAADCETEKELIKGGALDDIPY